MSAPEQPEPMQSTLAPDGVLRVRLDLGYDGGGFSGWAAQPGRRTVAGVLGAALAQLLRVEQDVALVVAGRTDAGVHARGQVAQFDVDAATWARLPGRAASEPGLALLRGLRGVLPHDVRVHRVSLAPPGFDARFSATWRRYSYALTDAAAGAPPLRRHDVLAVKAPNGLDVAAMNTACAALVGLNDFAAFCKKRDDPNATTVRTLLEYSWSRVPSVDGELIVARVVADAFCHSMVRALVGGALTVGLGRRETDWLPRVMTAGVRDSAVSVVPPHGLVLEEVGYPDDARLAERAVVTRSVRTLA